MKSSSNVIADNLEAYTHWWFWVLVIGLGMFAGIIVHLAFLAWVKRNQRLFWVEEVQTFDDGNQVVWTSGAMSYSYAYDLAKSLARRKRAIYPNSSDSYFRVGPELDKR